MSQETTHYCRGGEHCTEIHHLCRMVKKGSEPDRLRRLVRDARYMCKKCGRAAQRDEHLCKPSAL